MEDYVSLAILINLTERLRAEQCLIKSMVAGMLVQLDQIAKRLEINDAQTPMASDTRQKLRRLYEAGSAVAAHPTRGKPRD